MNVTYREKNGKIQAIISYKVNGKWKQKSKQGFSKQSEAKKWAKEKQFELMELERDNVIHNDMSLDDVIQEYVKVLKLRKCAKNTIISYQSLNNFLKPFNSTLVKDLSSYNIEVYFLEKSDETGFSYNTYLKHLKIILNFARDDLKILRENPARKLKLKPAIDNRIKFINKELRDEILGNASEKYKLFLKLAYNTGLRIGELLGITLKDLSPHNIDINKQWYDDGFHKLKTKNSYRQVPISLELYKELKSQTTDVNGRIFYYVYKYNINYYLAKYNTSIHCYRHTYVTRLLSQGISIKMVADIVGDTVEMVYKVYLELNQDTKKEELDQVRKMIN